MKAHILNLTKNINSDFFRIKIVQKLGLTLILSIVIGYLVSPQIIFRPTIYKEGDIIHQTITITEDLLIPDKISTSLKKERLLKELKPIYEFDPNVLKKNQKRIKKAFHSVRSQLSRLNKEMEEAETKNKELGTDYFSSMLNHMEIQRKIIFYQTYKSILEKRLKELHGETKLSARGFLKKKKLDYDLNSATQILKELEEKQKYSKIEEENLGSRFRQSAKEKETLKNSIQERQKNAINEFIKTLSVKFDEAELKTLDFRFYTEEIENKFLALTSKILSQKIINQKSVSNPKNKSEIEIINVKTSETTAGEDRRVFYKLEELYDLSEAKSLALDIAQEFFPGDQTGPKKNFIIMLVQKLITPTVSENRLEYERRKKELISMSPVFFSVKKGEIIARTGDRLTRSQVEMINGYYELVSNIDKIPRVLGIVFLVLFSLIIISFSFQTDGKINPLKFKDLILVMTAVLTTLIILKGGIVIGEIIEARYIQAQIFNYILPVALSSMLVGILIGSRAASMAGLLTSMFAAVMTGANHYYFFFAIISCMTASLPITKFESRYSILIHGLKISGVNLPIIIIINLIENNQIIEVSVSIIAVALAGGLFIAVFTSILLPFFESVFDVTTNIRLLELSNMNHPALKNLILKAPGTYQHSVMVGNLAESGASKIGANPLLARVASYYHDIGKMVDARYYVENQAPNSLSAHDNISPRQSADIIISHLRKGEKIADKHRLGKAIKDIMLQHHGRGLVKFFYNKAQERADKINRADFQYPGPKPQTPEAAVVMMADIAEASSRSLDNPTPEAIREIVEKLLWETLEDGHLDESGLTLKTFRIVVDAYISMLVTIHHHRIKYPENIKNVQKDSKANNEPRANRL